MWRELIIDFLRDLNSQRTRAFLTILAITWGTIAVVLLLSFGKGLGNQMMNGLLNAGNEIMILYGGETGMAFEGVPKGRNIHLEEEDAQLLLDAIPQIDIASPQYRAGVRLTVGRNSTNTECEGVNPNFEDMRRMYPAAGGRFLNLTDVMQQRRVVVLGAAIARDLFGDRNPVGQTLLLETTPFTVVGILQEKLQTSMNNGPDSRRAIMPYSTMKTMFGREHVNSIVVHPRLPVLQPQVKREIFRVFARKYHFNPEDDRTLFIWDFIENAKTSRKIGLGVEIFLFGVGFLTLLIAGVGVANVMYVVVKERTREIGIRMAVGARRIHILAQFVLEALLISFIGGTLGTLFCWGVVSIIRSLPSSDGVMQFFGKPVLSPGIVLLTFSILAVIGLVAGVFPARRAASVDPVESLRYE
jgi:putative ABC transport system permease protein